MFIKIDVVHVSELKPSVMHLHAPVKGEISVTDINSRLSQLTWDSDFHLLMPVSDWTCMNTDGCTCKISDYLHAFSVSLANYIVLHSG